MVSEATSRLFWRLLPWTMKVVDRSKWLTTFTGGRFYPGDPAGTEYRIEDIAHALSMTCRFAGQVPYFYSVAEHSLFTAYIVERHVDLVEENVGLALLHDAAEAYLGDLAWAVKYSEGLEGYRDLEHQVLDAILKRFHGVYPIDYSRYERVKQADNLALRNEAKVLGLLDETWTQFELPDLQLDSLVAEDISQRATKNRFLSKFDELVGKGLLKR